MIARQLRAFRETPKRHFLPTRGLAFDGRGRLWVLGAQGDSVAADVYQGTRDLGRLWLNCPGFAGGFDINGAWLAVSCGNRAPGRDSDFTIRLYHIDDSRRR
jgi:hypothetical protein